MADIYEAVPECNDEVQNVKNEYSGIVIAKWVEEGKTLLDIRGYDNHIYYKSPIENWKVTHTEEELANAEW